MATRVFIQFCLVIVLQTIDISAAARYKTRIEERVNILEVRFDAETRFRREDMSNLMDKMESVSAMFNLSAEHATCQQQKGIHDENPSDSRPMREVSKLWRHDLMQITKAFKDEKMLNVKIRDQFSNIVDKTRNAEEAMSRIDKTLDNVSNEINTVATDTKTVLNETTANQINLIEELGRVDKTLDNVSNEISTVATDTKTALDETTANQMKLVHDTTELKQELGRVSNEINTVATDTKTVLDETSANQIKLTELVHDTTELKQELGRVSNEINTVATDTKAVLDETSANQIKLTKLVHVTTELKQELGRVDTTLDNVSNEINTVATDTKAVLDETTANQIKLTEELDRVDTALDNVNVDIKTIATDIKTVLQNQIQLVHEMTELKQELLIVKEKSTSMYVRPRSCKELYLIERRVSGVYVVYPDGTPDPIRVFCDQETDGGGWTVFQRREDGSEDFYRGWVDYENGFGDLDGEFWLGNKYLSILTATCCQQLKIDLGDFEGEHKYAMYDEFQIGSKGEKYSLKVGGYSGNANDSLSYHNGSQFSTKDQDNARNGGNCAKSYKGAWWYNSCHYSNLNGQYLGGKHSSRGVGVNWYHWHGHYYSLKFTEMKFR